jgi:O-antigen/teichoic acid export membrane protein
MFKRIAATGSSDRAVALVDQGLLAITRFIAMVVFARTFRQDVFGEIALAVTMSYISVGLNRAIVVLPFVFESGSFELAKKNSPKWLTGTLIVALVFTLLLLYSSWLFYHYESTYWLGNAAIWSSFLCPSAIIYEYVRRQVIQERNIRLSIAQVLTFNILTMTLLPSAYYFASVPLAIASFSVPYIVGALVGLQLWKVKPKLDFSGAVESWKAHINMCAWGFAEYMADLAVGYGLGGVASAFFGPIGSAAFAATRNVVAPIYAITSALGTVEPPRFARQMNEKGLTGLRAAFSSAMILHILLVGVTGAAAVLLGDEALHLTYGEKFNGHTGELHLWVIGSCVFALCQPFGAWLLAVKKPQLVFYSKAFGGSVAVILALLLVSPFGLKGLLAGMVAGQIANWIGLFSCCLYTSLLPFEKAGRNSDDVSNK